MALSFRTIVFVGLASIGLSCGNNSGEAIQESEVVPIRSRSIVNGWQSYCAAPKGWIHEWDNLTDTESTITRLPLVPNDFRAGYGFVLGEELIFSNLVSGNQYIFDGEQYHRQPEITPCAPFSTDEYTLNSQADAIETGFVTACSNSRPEECYSIQILQGTWPYAYAEANGSILAATNFGEVLVFDNRRWCRTKNQNDTYQCDPSAEMLTSPTGIQFYSSLIYQNRTLVGEYPSGRLYEFNGRTLSPSIDFNPPHLRLGKHFGFEAQSMAEYCGDLFVGYWPKGEIWQYHYLERTWSRFTRLFSHPSDSRDFVPYSSRPDDDVPNSFFGQRVTALIPHGDSLYAFTSHLGGPWPRGIGDHFLTENQVEEYGTVYRIHRPGCSTSLANLQDRPDQGDVTKHDQTERVR